jgi:hypothetical protein
MLTTKKPAKQPCSLAYKTMILGNCQFWISESWSDIDFIFEMSV